MTTPHREFAAQWLAQDPDETTRAELRGLLAGDDVTLAARFSGRLEFGTAGLRGALGAGPMRMNRVVVAQAAAGLASYLTARETSPTVVVGYDARYNSEVFARDTAEIMTAAGVRAHLLPGPLPTPILAFAICHLGCSAGVMVTASHNPRSDNGYKVYLGDGCQIVPPADAEISAAISAVGRVDHLSRSQDYVRLDDGVASVYVDAVAALPTSEARDIRAVYTPLHGVGRDTVVDAVRRAGFPDLHTVAAQSDPDPDFPTVEFPNPEESGAMDLALALAADVNADLIVANDPDADRCAVGVRDGQSYRMLSGDEVGALLGDFLLRAGITGTYAASIVSSSILGQQAAAYGQPFQQTLTGFKWIGKIPTLVYGYEEALGYSVAPHIVRDKDGVSAIIRVLELAAGLKAQGRTLLDRLDEIACEHGVHTTGQLSMRVDDQSTISRAMSALGASPPRTLGGSIVCAIDDLADGYAGLPATEGIRIGLAGGARVIVRPSGTEPKLKCYIEVVVPVSESVAQARQLGQRSLEAIKCDLATVMGI